MLSALFMVERRQVHMVVSTSGYIARAFCLAVITSPNRCRARIRGLRWCLYFYGYYVALAC